MVLIIDDDSAVRLSIGLLVTRIGLEPVEASTERDALERVRDPRVRLVVLDMNLTLSSTGEQGIEMLRKIKILRPELPVILITGWGTIPLAVEGMKYGAADFITKPWSNDDLRAKIRRLIADADRTAEENRQVDSLEDIERKAIIHAIDVSDGNLSVAAQRLGITRQALYRRIEKYGL
ncbi:MAG: response regulator [Duncaniella sp.]|nr:response regulator [Duncaniella sp.]